MGSVSIDIDPIPPTVGQKVTIITSGLVEGHELKLDWDPLCEPATITVDAEGKASFVVPDGARSLIVIDPESETAAATAIRWT